MNTETEMNAMPTEPHREWVERQIEIKRQIAYANPVNGSDRHFAEAVRLDAMGDTAGAEAARAAGLARYDEIRTMYPWPEEA